MNIIKKERNWYSNSSPALNWWLSAFTYVRRRPSISHQFALSCHHYLWSLSSLKAVSCPWLQRSPPVWVEAAPLWTKCRINARDVGFQRLMLPTSCWMWGTRSWSVNRSVLEKNRPKWRDETLKKLWFAALYWRGPPAWCLSAHQVFQTEVSSRLNSALPPAKVLGIILHYKRDISLA